VSTGSAIFMMGTRLQTIYLGGNKNGTGMGGILNCKVNRDMYETVLFSMHGALF
jgi:hypothetical protein